MRLPTASSWQRAAACPASAVLPSADHTNPGAERGTAFHRWLEVFQSHGWEASRAEITPEIEDWAESPAVHRAVEWIPTGARYEVKLAWDPITGKTAEGPPDAGTRDYSWVPDGWLCGTADILAVTSRAVHVIDTKTGYTDPPPAKRNRQLRGLAMIAARHHGLDTAYIQILRIWPGDAAAMLPTFQLDALELALIEQDMRDMCSAIEAAREDPEKHLRSGPQCTYCDSMPWCPLMRRVVGTVMGDDEVDLTDDASCGEAWERVEAASAAVKRARAALEERAKRRPIPLPSGRIVRLQERERESINPRKAMPVLDRLEAAKAAEPKVSKASIKRAVGKDPDRYEAVMAELAKADAIETKTSATVQAVEE